MTHDPRASRASLQEKQSAARTVTRAVRGLLDRAADAIRPGDEIDATHDKGRHNEN